MPLDTSKLQIFSNHAQAAVESMANALYRTAFSTFVKETEDFTTGLASAKGQTFASPRGLGSNWFAGLDYAGAIDQIPVYEPGDIGMTSEPYAGFVCTHSPDIHLWKPIFSRGQIVAFAVGHVHNTDVGGAVPASLSRTRGCGASPTRISPAGRAGAMLPARCPRAGRLWLA